MAVFRVFNGPVPPFDEPAARAMLELGHVLTSPGPTQEVADLIRR